jgi:hypothetical protein
MQNNIVHEAVGGVVVGYTSASVFGAHVGALCLGLICATLATFWLASLDSRGKTFSSIVLAAILSGYVAPVAAAYAAANYRGFVVNDTLMILIGAVVGFLVPVLVPPAVTFAKRFLERGAAK